MILGLAFTVEISLHLKHQATSLLSAEAYLSTLVVIGIVDTEANPVALQGYSHRIAVDKAFES